MLDWIGDNMIVIVIVFLVVIIGITLINVSWNRNIVVTKNKVEPKDNVIGVYYLPTTLINITGSTKILIEQDDEGKIKSFEIKEQTFNLNTETRPDISVPLYLNYKHNPFSDEKITFQTNDMGLLENLETISNNKGRDILVTLAEAPAGIFSERALDTKKMFRKKEEAILIEKEYQKDFQVFSDTLLEGEVKVPWKINIFSELDIDEKREVIADFTLKSNSQPNPISNSFADVQNGLCFRTKSVLSLFIESHEGRQVSKEIKELNYFDPNSMYAVPIKTVPFAKRIHEIVVQNGELRSHKLSNPSSIEGFVSIPIKIARAIVAIPAQLISLQIGNANKKHKLEKLQLDNQMELATKEKELLEAKKELLKTRENLAELKMQASKEIDRLHSKLKKNIP